MARRSRSTGHIGSASAAAFRWTLTTRFTATRPVRAWSVFAESVPAHSKLPVTADTRNYRPRYHEQFNGSLGSKGLFSCLLPDTKISIYIYIEREETHTLLREEVCLSSTYMHVAPKSGIWVTNPFIRALTSIFRVTRAGDILVTLVTNWLIRALDGFLAAAFATATLEVDLC